MRHTGKRGVTRAGRGSTRAEVSERVIGAYSTSCLSPSLISLRFSTFHLNISYSFGNNPKGLKIREREEERKA